MRGERWEGVEGWEVGGGRVEDFVEEVSEVQMKGEDGVGVVLGRSLSDEASSSERRSNDSLDRCTPLNCAVGCTMDQHM